MSRTARPDRGAALAPRKRRRIVYDAVTFSEHDGVRYLHFGTEWVQGAMLLRRPDQILLEYAQQMMVWMLFSPTPVRLLQLGLGAAALTKFCYRRFETAQIVAVELNPSVIAAARTMFRLPPDDARLSVVEADAMAFVEEPAQHGLYDAIQVDLYDATARGPVLESIEFYQACRACLRMSSDSPCLITVNLFGDHASFGRNRRTITSAFDGRVLVLPEVHQGNRVALACAGAPLEISGDELYQRAQAIERSTRMPAKSWVDALKAEAGGRYADGRLRL